ncbi:MAG: alkaline phosphatase family protein [Acidimicrobiia bacterium]|nr:alkaline phosphatase family protein [Acidimicrobiia bacterium]
MVIPLRSPNFSGRSLLNLVAELERRLTGRAQFPGLDESLSATIPEARTYVLCLFDGLGNSMLDHPAATSLAASRVGAIDAMFPTQTTVNMATIATGLPPSQHGLISYQLFLPEAGQVVNTLKWTTLVGDPIDIDHASFLPASNLWERLATAGIEPITVQPGGFEKSPLSRTLYRGCRFEGAWTIDEIIDATVDVALEPGRMIFTYFPSVDVAAHISGQKSDEFAEALSAASTIWQRIVDRLPSHAVAIGTADHGHIDYTVEDKALIREGIEGITFYGDPRNSFVRAPDGEGERLAGQHPATWVPWDQVLPLLGPGPHHPAIRERAPDGLLVADPGKVLLPPTADKRMIGYHGGTLDQEMKVPLLVG